MLDFIREIDLLWKPVYPCLARHIGEVYGRKDGNVLEVGPFCGVISDLKKQEIGNSFLIASFPPGMSGFFREELRRQGMEGEISIIETDSSLLSLNDRTVDLLVFRGALFFPSIFRVDYQAIYRVLREEGIAFVGGGFGKYTPQSVIQSIGQRSKELNLEIGKREITAKSVMRNIEASGVRGKIQIMTEGGLWVLMEKLC